MLMWTLLPSATVLARDSVVTVGSNHTNGSAIRLPPGFYPAFMLARDSAVAMGSNRANADSTTVCIRSRNRANSVTVGSNHTDGSAIRLPPGFYPAFMLARDPAVAMGSNRANVNSTTVWIRSRNRACTRFRRKI